MKLLLLAIVLLLALAAAGPAFCRATPPPGPAGVRAAIAVEPRHALAGFGAPIRAFALPPILQEVSAVTGVDEHTVACLQDEKGIVFLIDVRDGSVRASLPFGPDGDYEGLARVGQDYFVLRSDGLLARVTPRSSGLAIAESFALQTPNHDREGLCHDAANHVLLLAPKDVVKPDAADAPDAAPEDRRRAAAERKAARDRRTLFAFDLQTSRLREEPALRLSVAELRAAAEARGDDLPTRTDRRGGERSALRLLFSCVAVEPRTGWIWLLSAVDRVLLAVDRDGTLQALHRLEAELLPKPEGVTFLPGGEMVLTSEGVDGPGRLVVYRRQ